MYIYNKIILGKLSKMNLSRRLRFLHFSYLIIYDFVTF